MICLLSSSYHILKCNIPLWQLVKLFEFTYLFSRERPAAIPIEIKSIDDTSNFDEFPDSDILTPTGKLPVSLQHFSDVVPVLSRLEIIQPPLLFFLFLIVFLVQPRLCLTRLRPTWRTRTGSLSTTPTNASKAWLLEELYRPTWSQERDEHPQTPPWNLNESSKPLLSGELQPDKENSVLRYLSVEDSRHTGLYK